VNISPREYEADGQRRTINPETYRKLYGVRGGKTETGFVSVLFLVYMLMDTFLPAAVVLLTLGSIGLALVNLNAEKNVNKNYSEESIRGGKMYTFSCTWKQFFSGMESENTPLTDFLSILRVKRTLITFWK
jgi:hypothetical protein